MRGSIVSITGRRDRLLDFAFLAFMLHLFTMPAAMAREASDVQRQHPATRVRRREWRCTLFTIRRSASGGV
jgi:hypothetical protein